MKVFIVMFTMFDKHPENIESKAMFITTCCKKSFLTFDDAMNYAKSLNDEDLQFKYIHRIIETELDVPSKKGDRQKLSSGASEMKNAYNRAWRRSHPEKVMEYQERYWNKQKEKQGKQQS